MMQLSYFLFTSFLVGVHAQSSSIEPCASVSSIVAAQATDASLQLSPQIAYECLQTVPLYEDDALKLLDGWEAFMEWQSDPTYKADPPEGYLYPGIDYFARIADLRERVVTGNITKEIDLHWGINDIMINCHDGHLDFYTDFLSIFNWQRLFPLIAISKDGQSVPDIWVAPEAKYVSQLDYQPSPITMIDGMDVSDYLQLNVNLGQAGPQDPDSTFNTVLYDITQNEPQQQYGSFAWPPNYPGPDVTLTFANGTTKTYPNMASVNGNWTGVTDGASLYQKFLNATVKMEAAQQSGGGGGDIAKSLYDRSKLDDHALYEHESNASNPYYEVIVQSDDKSFLGLILKGQYNNTAVVVMNQFSQSNATQVTNLFSKFLRVCRQTGVDHLVIDLNSNVGGQIALATNLQKQLFPDYYAYAQRAIRAQPQFEVVGEAVANVTIAILEATHGNRTDTINYGGTGTWDSTCWISETGKHFPDWPAYYGPVPNHGDQYTNLYTWDVSDVQFTSQQGGSGQGEYAIPGYGDFPLPPQTFKSDNIVILGEGVCHSSCTTFSHFLKWQGKVKSIVMGGRPSLGPMQQMGGIKGATASEYPQLISSIQKITTHPNPPDILQRANETKLKELISTAEYLQFRTSNPSDAGIGVNLANAMLGAEIQNANSTQWAGKDQIPLQYLYEAADCRMFYTQETAFSRVYQWIGAANQAFGFNGTQPWSGCVAGSTGHPTSLSGDAKLYNGGQPQNVTNFNPPDVGTNDVPTDWFDEKGNEYVPLVKSVIASLEAGSSPTAAAATSSASAPGASATGSGQSNTKSAAVRLSGAGFGLSLTVAGVFGGMLLL